MFHEARPFSLYALLLTPIIHDSGGPGPGYREEYHPIARRKFETKIRQPYEMVSDNPKRKRCRIAPIILHTGLGGRGGLLDPPDPLPVETAFAVGLAMCGVGGKWKPQDLKFPNSRRTRKSSGAGSHLELAIKKVQTNID
jgi:hypothetical protein